jgi:hypothetical protein
MSNWKEVNWMDRADIISQLESIGIACYDDESTQLLRETWVENKESGNF